MIFNGKKTRKLRIIFFKEKNKNPKNNFLCGQIIKPKIIFFKGKTIKTWK